MKTSEKGINLIKNCEGCRLTAYKCPAEIWTIGYGHTASVKQGQTITKEQAINLLKYDLIVFEKAVNLLVKAPLTQGQFDALVSFTFNLGKGALQRSTLLKKLNVKDYQGASNEFLKWVYANGKKLDGLVKRRQAEKDLFCS